MQVKISEVNVDKSEVLLKKLLLVLAIAIGSVMIMILALSFGVKMQSKNASMVIKAPADAGWFYEDGTIADLASLKVGENGKTAKMSKSITNAALVDGCMNFVSTNCSFKVYVNGKTIYSYEPSIKSFYGKSDGYKLHLIVTSLLSETAVVAIEAKPLDPSLEFGFSHMYFQKSSAYLEDMFKQELWGFIISMVIFAVGIMLTLVGLVLEHKAIRKLEVASLGILTMVLVSWTESGSVIMSYISGNPGYIRMLNYYALIFMPLSALTLIYSLTRSKVKWPMFAMTGLTLAVTAINLITVGGGKTDYHNTLIFSHILFVLAVISAVYMTIAGWGKNEEGAGRGTLVLVGFGALILSGIADLVRFYMLERISDKSFFTKIGLVIFVLSLSLYEFRQFFMTSQKNKESEEINKIIDEDELTGLSNNQALQRYKISIGRTVNGFAIMTYFNVLEMKKNNERFGVDIGDAFIVSGADAVNRSFGEKGHVFRIGGDEFLAVIDENVVTKKGTTEERVWELFSVYKDCERKFMDEIAALNGQGVLPAKLGLAYGMAEVNFEEEKFDDGVSKAKKRMEETKDDQRLKALS